MHKSNDTFFQQSIIACKQLLSAGDVLIIGLSGGPDSVFLAHLLASLKNELSLTLIAAHLDHEWRASARQDALFCQKLATQLGITFEVTSMSALPVSIKPNGSKEEYARKARRFFFEQLAKKYGATAIALGHHAQDQQETFFIRLLRGTSLAGLTGMKTRDGLYIRPLLTFNKDEILAYLEKNKIPFCHDETNESAAFLRNRIRQAVIPALQETDSRFNTTFAKTLKHMQTTEEFLQEHTASLFDQLVERNDDHYYLRHKELQKMHPTIKQRILISWLCAYKVPFAVSESFFHEMLRFLENDQAKTHQMHPSWQLKKTFSSVYLQKNV